MITKYSVDAGGLAADNNNIAHQDNNFPHNFENATHTLQKLATTSEVDLNGPSDTKINKNH